MKYTHRRYKNRTIPAELLKEIVDNNSLVEETICEYEKCESLEIKLKQLKNAKIQTGSEMKGEGLRRTYVAMGREWLEGRFVSRWKDEAEQIQQYVKLQRLRKQVLATSLPLLFLGLIFFYSYTVYSGIKPAFGDSMKYLRSSDLVFDDISRFANLIFREIKEPAPEHSFSFLNQRTPPELRAAWSDHFTKMQCASSL